MKSRVNIAGHPIHPILVTLPIGLWSFVVIADFIFLFGLGNDSWRSTAFYGLGGGIIFAIPAMITGYIDYGGIRQPVAVKVATFHLWLNVVTTILMTISFIWRWQEAAPPYSWIPVAISTFAAVLLSLSGWLGGELVSRYHVSVHE